MICQSFFLYDWHAYSARIASTHENRAYDSIENRGIACQNLLGRFDINRDVHCVSMQYNVSEMCLPKFTFLMNASPRIVINGNTATQRPCCAIITVISFQFRIIPEKENNSNRLIPPALNMVLYVLTQLATIVWLE